MNETIRFMIVDDDPTNNLICKITINRTIPDCAVSLFTDPRQALDHIMNYPPEPGIKTILFLDINMPQMTGWEFLEQFSEIPEANRKPYEVYMVSSSVDQRDQMRAQANEHINGYISKPVKADFLRENFLV